MSHLLTGIGNLAIAIPALLMGLQLLRTVMRESGQERTTALMGSLMALTLGINTATWGLRSLLIDPMAPVDVIRPWVMIVGVMAGLTGFFLVYWAVMVTHQDFFVKRKWALVLPLFGTLPYLFFTVIGVSEATSTVVLNFVTDIGIGTSTVGQAFGLIALIDWFFYLLLIPLLTFFRHYKSVKGTPAARNTVFVLLGLLVWALLFFIGILLRAAPGADYFSVASNLITALCWFMIWYGYELSHGID